jgi:hypothetical protein
MFVKGFVQCIFVKCRCRFDTCSRFRTLIKRGVQPSNNVSVSLLACSINSLSVTFLRVTQSRRQVFHTLVNRGGQQTKKRVRTLLACSIENSVRHRFVCHAVEKASVRNFDKDTGSRKYTWILRLKRKSGLRYERQPVGVERDKNRMEYKSTSRCRV